MQPGKTWSARDIGLGIGSHDLHDTWEEKMLEVARHFIRAHWLGLFQPPVKGAHQRPTEVSRQHFNRDLRRPGRRVRLHARSHYFIDRLDDDFPDLLHDAS